MSVLRVLASVTDKIRHHQYQESSDTCGGVECSTGTASLHSHRCSIVATPEHFYKIPEYTEGEWFASDLAQWCQTEGLESTGRGNILVSKEIFEETRFIQTQGTDGDDSILGGVSKGRVDDVRTGMTADRAKAKYITEEEEGDIRVKPVLPPLVFPCPLLSDTIGVLTKADDYARGEINQYIKRMGKSNSFPHTVCEGENSFEASWNDYLDEQRLAGGCLYKHHR